MQLAERAVALYVRGMVASARLSNRRRALVDVCVLAPWMAGRAASHTRFKQFQ
jgi:hypothetical protein